MICRAVEVDLSGSVEGVPERFVPEAMRGSLLDAEHRARYWWAAGLVPGKRVLDAGCGLAYGSAILAQAGAAEVIGVDSAEPVVEAAQARMAGRVRIEHGDVGRLDFPADSFDVVVCFEVIEHVQNSDAVLDELARVLRPGGVVALSSPNRDAYAQGNPHHVHEFRPDELRQALESRFAHVRLIRQHDFLTSAIIDDEGFTADDGSTLAGVDVRKVVGQRPGEETYTLALASEEPVPEPPRMAVLTGTLELRQWLEHFDAQQRAFEAQENHLAELKALVEQRSSLLQRLEEAERRAADRLDLMESLTHAEALLGGAEGRLADREEQLAEAEVRQDEAQRARAEAEAAHAQALRTLEGVVGSASWKITAPLRGLKRLRGGSRGPAP